MKKVVLIFAFIGVMFSAMAQEGLILGVHYAYNSTWLMNKQVFDEGPEMDIASSFGSYYGLIVGYNFADNFGVELNINPNKIVQKYQGGIKYLLSDDRYTYDASTVLRTMDIPVLLKFGNSAYFEIGPLVQIINKATYIIDYESDGALTYGSYNGLFPITDQPSTDVKSTFKNNAFGATFGFGANFNLVEDVLKLNFGVRFNYILTDIEGVNGLGLTKESGYVLEDTQVNFYNHPLYGGIKIGLVYYFD